MTNKFIKPVDSLCINDIIKTSLKRVSRGKAHKPERGFLYGKY